MSGPASNMPSNGPNAETGLNSIVAEFLSDEERREIERQKELARVALEEARRREKYRFLAPLTHPFVLAGLVILALVGAGAVAIVHRYDFSSLLDPFSGGGKSHSGAAIVSSEDVKRFKQKLVGSWKELLDEHVTLPSGKPKTAKPGHEGAEEKVVAIGVDQVFDQFECERPAEMTPGRTLALLHRDQAKALGWLNCLWLADKPALLHETLMPEVLEVLDRGSSAEAASRSVYEGAMVALLQATESLGEDKDDARILRALCPSVTASNGCAIALHTSAGSGAKGVKILRALQAKADTLNPLAQSLVWEARGRRSLDRGKPGEALTHFQRALAKSPGSAIGRRLHLVGQTALAAYLAGDPAAVDRLQTLLRDATASPVDQATYVRTVRVLIASDLLLRLMKSADRADVLQSVLQIEQLPKLLTAMPPLLQILGTESVRLKQLGAFATFLGLAGQQLGVIAPERLDVVRAIDLWSIRRLLVASDLPAAVAALEKATGDGPLDAHYAHLRGVAALLEERPAAALPEFLKAKRARATWAEEFDVAWTQALDASHRQAARSALKRLNARATTFEGTWSRLLEARLLAFEGKEDQARRVFAANETSPVFRFLPPSVVFDVATDLRIWPRQKRLLAAVHKVWGLPYYSTIWSAYAPMGPLGDLPRPVWLTTAAKASEKGKRSQKTKKGEAKPKGKGKGKAKVKSKAKPEPKARSKP